VLDEPDRSIDWLLMVRSKGKEETAGMYLGSVNREGSSGNRGNQSSVWWDRLSGSSPNIGEHSKLSLRYGESPISGDVKFVNAVDGGADPKPSLKMSLGETVRTD
jgi:hypothetical protein